MATGACGINCDVCQLNLLGHCSSCGPGRSDLAAKKSAIQQRILGYPCAILECARLNHIDYCSRDCLSFPCGNFSGSNYPYGRSFLEMQHRRRNEGPPAADPSGSAIAIDPSWWEALAEKELGRMANFTLTDIDGKANCLVFPFLNRTLRVDVQSRSLLKKEEGKWQKMKVPLLELVVLDYFNKVNFLIPLKNELVSVSDFNDSHYFSGWNQLKKGSLLKRFGDDPNGFTCSGTNLGGQEKTMGDAAFRLFPFPRIPITYILWLGSEEFAPRLSILFDRSIEKALSPPAIWCLVTLCNYYLIRGAAL